MLQKLFSIAVTVATIVLLSSLAPASSEALQPVGAQPVYCYSITVHPTEYGSPSVTVSGLSEGTDIVFQELQEGIDQTEYILRSRTDFLRGDLPVGRYSVYLQSATNEEPGLLSKPVQINVVAGTNLSVVVFYHPECEKSRSPVG